MMIVLRYYYLYLSVIMCVVVVVVFTLETVLISIQYLLFLTLQGKETNFRGHKLTQNKVQRNKNKIKRVVFSSRSFWTSSSLDVPAGVTQEESHRVFYPPSFCGACLNISREKDSAIPFPRRR